MLLYALGEEGTSDDETDDESEPSNRKKLLRRKRIGHLNPDLASIWEAVESYPCKYHPSPGNRPFIRIAAAKTSSKDRRPKTGLPWNFYDPTWLQGSSDYFRKRVKAEFPLPALVSYYTYKYNIGSHFYAQRPYIGE